MDIIANKKIENLPFDKTILCTITTIKDKDEGIYEVSANTDSAQANRSYFQAFAQESATYEVGDNVYVNVPQNDFSNQKTIISKYISEQAKPVNYINPMEQFIKLEEINYTEEPNYYGLKANSETQFQYKIFEKVYDLNNMPKNYDCLGISADFITLLGSYKPLDGEYGLRFEFGGLKDGWDTDTGDINKYLALKEVTFSNREMYGMTYDFFTPSHQEKLINLQDFPYPIKIIRCYFYQNKNFIDINNNKIPGEDYVWNELNKTWKKPIPKESGEEQRYIVVDPDIQVDNLLCTFGYLMSDAKDGDLRLYTTSRIKYTEDKSEYQNKKTLKLRWLLNDEDGNLKAIDELADRNSKFWEDKIIYLYKYTYGKDEVDPYAGPFWERIASYGKYVATQTIREVELDDGKYKYKPESRLLQIFSSSRDPWGNVDILNKGVSKFDKPFNIEVDITNDDKNSVFARYKVIILEYTDPIEKSAVSSPYTASIQFDEGASDVVIEPEDVIIEGNYRIIDETSLKIYESNEITFENENEVAGKAAMALINGLELECVDGSNGIYRIYGEDNKITAQTNSQSMKLRANFNAINILGLDAGEANITWYYPKTNTMFVSPIDKTGTKIDVYKIVSDSLDMENLNKYYVKVDEQYYQLKNITIDDSTVIGYTRDERDYVKADSQAVYLKGQETVLTADWDKDSDPNYYILEQQLDITQYKDNDVDSIMPFNNEIVYTIDSFYASNRTNNTIKCKIERYGREYWAEKEFFFGHQGNNGTNYAFDISLEREYNNTTHKEVSDTIVPFLKQENNNFIKVKATLIYGKEEITDLNNIRWSWEVISQYEEDGETINHIAMYDSNFIETSSPSGPFIYLKLNDISDLSEYYAILKAEITKDVIDINKSGQNDANKQRPVTLSTYLPIGISANNNIETYIGGTSILYNDYGGDPVYYEGEHQLIGINKYSVEWKFLNSDTSATSDLNSLSPDSYYPRMLERQEEGKTHTYEWFIRPTSMYFNGINNTGRIIVKNGDIIIFVQPIFIAQNAWGNQTINQWDGALKIDSENNYILSAMLGAGIKNDDNTFSGVLLGQVGKDYDAKTGIYGYGEGVQTYGFREDGTAFIGASGMGRIEFDTKNNTGIIKGGRYSTTDDNDIITYTNEYTMEINLSQGKIVGRKHKKDNSEDTLEYVFDAQANTYPLKIGKSNNEKFKVAWDGTLTATGAHFGNWSDTSGYSSGNDGTIESILQQIANSAKTADDNLTDHLEDTDATVAQHWEPETLFNQSVYWPNEEYIQEKDDDNNLLYWTDSSKQTKTTENTGIPVMIENPDYNYFVLTNTDYGTSATHKYYLSKDGSFTANNGVFSGIVTAYAGDFGGWSLAPGILSYGYNMTYAQNDTQNYWTGDFFTNSSTHQDYNIGADPFNSGNIATAVSVDSNKAFIYLRNSGNGITINNFGGQTSVISPPFVDFNIEQNKDFLCTDPFNNLITSFNENDIISLASNIYNKDNDYAYVKVAFKSSISGTLRIYLNVSSESNYDFLVLSKLNKSLNTDYDKSDENAIIMLSGSEDNSQDYEITANENYYITIKYMKDSSRREGSDLGQVTFDFFASKNGINNIIFSLGKNFAVDKDGTLYASNGYFNGDIQASSGQIGGDEGWWISAGKIQDYGKRTTLYSNITEYGSGLVNFFLWNNNEKIGYFMDDTGNSFVNGFAYILNRRDMGVKRDCVITSKYMNQNANPVLKISYPYRSNVELSLLGLKGTLLANQFSWEQRRITGIEGNTISYTSQTVQLDRDVKAYCYGLAAMNRGGYFYYSFNKTLLNTSDYNDNEAWEEKYLVSSLTESLRVEKLRNIEFSNYQGASGALIQCVKFSAIANDNEYNLTALAAADQKGSATQPIYIDSNGVPTQCTYTLEASVPPDAVFTGGLSAPTSLGLYAYRVGSSSSEWEPITPYYFFFEESLRSGQNLYPFGSNVPVFWYGNHYLVKGYFVVIGEINLPLNSHFQGVLQTTAPCETFDYLWFGITDSSNTSWELEPVPTNTSYSYRGFTSSVINWVKSRQTTSNQHMSLYLDLENFTSSSKKYYLAFQYTGSKADDYYNIGDSDRPMGIRGIGRYYPGS